MVSPLLAWVNSRWEGARNLRETKEFPFCPTPARAHPPAGANPSPPPNRDFHCFLFGSPARVPGKQNAKRRVDSHCFMPAPLPPHRDPPTQLFAPLPQGCWNQEPRSVAW